MLLNDTPDLKIDAIYAYLAQDEEGEGIMAAQVIIGGVPTMMPMVGADMDRIKSLLPIVRKISQESGRQFKLYRFDNKIELDITGL